MTGRTFLQSPARAGTSWESLIVLGAVTLFSSLAAADRLAAWLIGEFPTYAFFWKLRFEFLRPIGVYYDMVERNLGGISPSIFSAVALGAAALIAAGVVSRIRLARAVSCHLTLGAAAVLGVMSWDPGFSLRPHAEVGMASQPYAVLGIALALVTGAMCLRIHAEYLGWHPATSRVVRRARIMMRRLRAALGTSIGDLADQTIPAPARLRAARVAVRATRSHNTTR